MKVETAFHNEYSSADLEATLARAEETPSSNTYIIGRIEDAKNREFSRVMLMQDALVLEEDSDFGRANRINHLYTGISRARDELILPLRLREWVEDQI